MQVKNVNPNPLVTATTPACSYGYNIEATNALPVIAWQSATAIDFYGGTKKIRPICWMKAIGSTPDPDDSGNIIYQWSNIYYAGIDTLKVTPYNPLPVYGKLNGPLQEVNPSDIFNTTDSPSITIDTYGNIHLAWVDGTILYYSVLDLDNGKWRKPKLIGYTDCAPALVYTFYSIGPGAGPLYLFWRNFVTLGRGDNGKIYWDVCNFTQEVGEDLNPLSCNPIWTGAKKIVDKYGNDFSASSSPAAAIDPDINILYLAWTNDNNQIWWAFADPADVSWLQQQLTGTLQGQDEQITAVTNYAPAIRSVGLVTDGSVALIAWTGTTTQAEEGGTTLGNSICWGTCSFGTVSDTPYEPVTTWYDFKQLDLNSDCAPALAGMEGARGVGYPLLDQTLLWKGIGEGQPDVGQINYGQLSSLS